MSVLFVIEIQTIQDVSKHTISVAADQENRFKMYLAEIFYLMLKLVIFVLVAVELLMMGGEKACPFQIFLVPACPFLVLKLAPLLVVGVPLKDPLVHEMVDL